MTLDEIPLTQAPGPSGAATPTGRWRRLAGIRRFIAQIRAARGVPKWILYSGVGIVLFFGILAIFAPLIAPYGFADASSNGVDFPKQAAPSGSHLFGTTVQSTDVLSRVIWGARTEIEVVVLSVLFALAIGVPLGLISGYVGGKLDRGLVLIMDALFAFPYLLLAIVIAFLLSDKIGQGILTAAIAITIVYIPQYFRVVRNHVISVREEPYVEAARALGAKRRTIIGRYVFFNVIQNVPVIATLNAADAILTLAALGFLGYGRHISTKRIKQRCQRRLSLIACAAPAAMTMLAPTTPFAPSIPTPKSAMCMEPPLPPQLPPSRPNSSRIMARGSAPLARVWP